MELSYSINSHYAQWASNISSNRLPSPPRKLMWYEESEKRAVVSKIFTGLAVAFTLAACASGFIAVPLAIISSVCLGVLAVASVITAIAIYAMKDCDLDPSYRQKQRNALLSQPELPNFSALNEARKKYILNDYDIQTLIKQEITSLTFEQFIQKHKIDGLKGLNTVNLSLLRGKWIGHLIIQAEADEKKNRNKLDQILVSEEARIFNLKEEELLPHYLPKEWSITQDINALNYSDFIDKYTVEMLEKLTPKQIELLKPKCIQFFSSHSGDNLPEVLEWYECKFFKLTKDDLRPPAHFAIDLANMDYETFINKYGMYVLTELTTEQQSILRPKCIAYFSYCNDEDLDECLESDQVKFFKITKEELRPPGLLQFIGGYASSAFGYIQKSSGIVTSTVTGIKDMALKKLVPRNLQNAANCASASIQFAKEGKYRCSFVTGMGSISSLMTYAVEQELGAIDPQGSKVAQDILKYEKL